MIRDGASNRAPDRILRPNPQMVAVQSRFLSPSYAGPGKWSILEPASLRSFLATTPDNAIAPSVFRLLVEATRGRAADEIAAAVPGTSPSTVDKLQDAGILVDPAIEMAEPLGYLGCYVEAVFDFPFLDYTSQTWQAEDQAIMDAYAAQAPHPPVFTTRPGQLLTLPAPDASRLGAGRDSIEVLSAVLHTTFAATGWIDGGKYGPWLRKTSPSGGARHPLDGVVVLGRPLGGLSAGAYAYDAEHHALGSILSTGPMSVLAARAPITILARAHIERASWRYRDIRALRPVLLDAGHIAETLCAALRCAGWDPTLYYVRERPDTDRALDWLEDPVLFAVTDGLTPTSAGPPPLAPVAGDPVRTNPCAYLRFADTGLVAATVWPRRGEIDITLQDLMVMTHCLPSRRDDRDVRRDGILAANPGVKPADVDRLVAAGILVDAGDVPPLERSLAPCVHHGWFLSVLAMLDGRATGNEPNPRPAYPSQWDKSEDLLRTLHARRTTRAFTDEPITLAVLDQVLSALPMPSLEEIQVWVAALAVHGLAHGLHRWSPNGLSGPNGPVSRDDVRRLTIGQSWAGDGAAVVWLVRKVNTRAPEEYEPDIIDLGRLGQRLTLAATEAGVGIFLTPALNDRQLFTRLGISQPGHAMAYAFTLGRKAK